MKKREVYFAGSRSQITLFIVMALVIIIGGIVYFSYQGQLAPKQEIVAPEAAPLKSFVDNCIKIIAEDGLERIGLSGGYIRIPPGIDDNPKTYLSNLPQSGFKMPYWWHDGIEAVPPEDFIKDQLKNHIRNELQGCVSNFEPFENQFEINQLKDPLIEINFNDEDTSIEMKYPLEIVAKDASFSAKIEDFGYTIPIRFKRVYGLAKLIMERENNDYFLEKRTIDLMSLDRDIPVTDIEVTCSAKTWELSKIKKKIMELLRFNLPYVKIIGTDFNPNKYAPNPEGRQIYSQTYYQSHYVLDVEQNPGNKYKNMKVSVRYDNWPMDIFARPSQNGILKSNADKGSQMLKFFCLHVWHFTYDISYPVVATILDQETDTNSRYQFNFAFKVDIDHNTPNRVNKGTTLFEASDEISSAEYCGEAEKETTIFTVDNSTGDSIKDVNLTFACGRFYCDLGKTEWLSLGAAAGITKIMPYCVYGVLRGTKEGYLDSQEFIQTDVDGKSFVMLMNPVKEFADYKVVKHLLSDPSVEEELAGNEKASILVKSNETGFEDFAFYPKEGNFRLKVPLKDAKYEATIYLVDQEEIVGGYIGEWKVSKGQLEGSQEIVFHVIYQGAASEEDKAMFIAGLGSSSKKVPAPELK
ncbi:hypothetical protein HYX06_00895 [Candidatus Woesearchaeota archaeon]|nr:hypothetical protein [Candidatus Woesearchaeota archaeon]